MDYSSANMSLWNIIIQLGLIAGVILLSQFLRSKLSFVRKSMMPVAVLGGFILLILKYLGVVKLDADLLEMLVYHCIALGFIAMSLRTTGGQKSRGGQKIGLRSGALIVSTYLVQGVAGLIITMGLAYTFMPGFFKAAGLLLPMGYGQGPGQANNIGGSYEAMGFAGGQSFGLAIAASGYLCACIVGVIMLNILNHRHKIAPRTESKGSRDLSVGFFQDNNELPVSDSIDRLSVQFALILLVYLLTYLLTKALAGGVTALAPGLTDTVNTLLWGFNFVVGSAVAMLVRLLLNKAQKSKIIEHQYQNNYLLNRLSGFFFDIMIVAGISAINMEELSGLWLPFVLLSLAGAVLTWLHLRWVCKKLYPDYYYEGLISMYGMLTGTIGSGILLLREMDPEFSTPAANNLLTGSSFAIIFGAPILVLVSLAPKSDLLCLATLCIAAVYLVLLVLLIFKVGGKKERAEEK